MSTIALYVKTIRKRPFTLLIVKKNRPVQLDAVTGRRITEREELAAAATTAAVVLGFAAAAGIVIAEQQNEDDDEKQPGAVTAAEQISQAHE